VAPAYGSQVRKADPESTRQTPSLALHRQSGALRIPVNVRPLVVRVFCLCAIIIRHRASIHVLGLFRIISRCRFALTESMEGHVSWPARIIKCMLTEAIMAVDGVLDDFFNQT